MNKTVKFKQTETLGERSRTIGGIPDGWELRKTGSLGQADVFFKAGYIEAWGRGTVKIMNACRKAGLPDPEFSELTGGFLVSFSKAEVAEPEKIRSKIGENAEKGLGEKLGVNQVKIINLITENRFVTITELADKIGISPTAIENSIAKLKAKGIIRRAGPDKGGHWEVVE